MMKQNSQGITLIALVITIIVLLILAGISIATLTGENGIITEGSKAKEKSIEEEEKEQIKLAYNAVMAEKLENADNTLITAEELQKELDNLNAEAIAQGSNPIKIMYSKTGNTYKVDTSKGEISKIDPNIKMISFSITFEENTASFEVEQGTSWSQFLRENNPLVEEIIRLKYWGYDKESNWFGIKYSFSVTAMEDQCYQLKTVSRENVEKDMLIASGEYILEDGWSVYWDEGQGQGLIPFK